MGPFENLLNGIRDGYVSWDEWTSFTSFVTALFAPYFDFSEIEVPDYILYELGVEGVGGGEEY